MTIRPNRAIAFALLALPLLLADAATPLLARGGAAANIMNSPGYQRRLQESRQQLGEQPEAQPPATSHHRKRHRRAR